jgi:lactate dehydrogenase-like 2-hydroxyacid dehydrogenase
LKPKVLVSTGKLNFPEDLAESLRPLADVAYVQGDYAEQLREATAVVVSMEAVNDAYLAKAPKLKVVARFGVGYDTVDVEACTRRKVYVTYTPDVLSAAVADITWALILGFMRRIPEADRFTREEWGKRARGFPFGWDISGKTLGFLGLGRIGREAAKRAQGFDVRMIYRDIVPKPELERLYGVKPVGFEELLRTSDILSIHVPLLPSTRHIIGRKELAMMKPTAIIINTSRGPVIDQDALTEALKTRRIAGAALDVFEEEPIPLTHPLLKLDNLVVTPHIASATRETRRRMAERCAESVRALLEGKRPPFMVPEQGNVSF